MMRPGSPGWRPGQAGRAGGDGSLGRLRAPGASAPARARPGGCDRQRQAGARLRQGERPPGQDRPGRCRGDRPLRRVCPAVSDAGAGRRHARAGRIAGLPPAADRRDHGPAAAARSSRDAPAPAAAQADLARLRRDKAEIETLLRRAIDRAPARPRLRCSVRVGLSPATLLAVLPELGSLDRRQSPAWSASRRSPRTAGSSAANASSPRAAARSAACSTWPRSAPAAAARASPPSIVAWSPGEATQVALIATMRKMLVTLNAIARADQPWSDPALKPAA